MTTFRYSLTGNWYKGNTHLHSVASDGGKTKAELAAMYSAAGYDFLFLTDHWVASRASADPAAYPLAWFDGLELDGRDALGSVYHVVALGTFDGLEREMGLDAGLASARAQGGLLILAHPQWMGNTFEEVLRRNVDGIEVYNHVCRWLNGKGEGSPYWHALLAQAPAALGLASDDGHLTLDHPGWNGGWVMVNAAECTQTAILAALRAGNFYSSTGPTIESLEYDGETLRVRCSPVQIARLVGPRWNGMRVGEIEGNPIREAAFRVPADWPYAYLEIEDDQRRKAWSNALFIP